MSQSLDSIATVLESTGGKLIELAAVRHSTDYYRSRAGGSQVVDSIEKDGVGWDLNVTAPTGVSNSEDPGAFFTQVLRLAGHPARVPNTEKLIQRRDLRRSCARIGGQVEEEYSALIAIHGGLPKARPTIGVQPKLDHIPFAIAT
ncbi:hypothetical protein [Methylobacterium bullatum]|uniref:hypothetical protein n=1 Tax=Methylobacterium bullatum TaxID=570505 RepID=UPI0030D4704C